jgi:hypothetical protein
MKRNVIRVGYFYVIIKGANISLYIFSHDTTIFYFTNARGLRNTLILFLCYLRVCDTFIVASYWLEDLTILSRSR